MGNTLNIVSREESSPSISVQIDSNSNLPKTKCSKSRDFVSQNFCVNGLDYLPNCKKKHEMKLGQNNTLRLFHFDSINWSASYLKFFRDNIDKPENEFKQPTDVPIFLEDATNNSNVKKHGRITRCFTIESIESIDFADDWRQFPSYPFENIVLSGGGSKGYSYIGSLKVYERFGFELCIVVTNLSRMRAEYINMTTGPNFPIRDAVRMSMSFPVIFQAVRSNLTGIECLYTDGGLLDQYPIQYFDGAEEKECLKNEMEFFMKNKTIGLYVVSEKTLDYKIWQELFNREIPFKPSYLPNTKLARNHVKQQMSLRKRIDKKISKDECIEELRSSMGEEAVEMFDHYNMLSKIHVDIANFGQYFITTIETLLISQRKVHVSPQDVLRTAPINCGYVGTNDYDIEPGDRRFLLMQGYSCTERFLKEYMTRLHSFESLDQTAGHVGDSTDGCFTNSASFSSS